MFTQINTLQEIHEIKLCDFIRLTRHYTVVFVGKEAEANKQHKEDNKGIGYKNWIN